MLSIPVILLPRRLIGKLGMRVSAALWVSVALHMDLDFGGFVRYFFPRAPLVTVFCGESAVSNLHWSTDKHKIFELPEVKKEKFFSDPLDQDLLNSKGEAQRGC